MLEQGTLRQFSSTQQYMFYDITRDTSIDKLVLSAKYSYGNFLLVEPEDLLWQNCQDRGFAGYGVFEVRVCIKETSWYCDPPFKYTTGHVLFVGDSIEKIQTKAADWLRANQDTKNAPYLHHNSGRSITPILMKVYNEEAYIPKEA